MYKEYEDFVSKYPEFEKEKNVIEKFMKGKNND